MFEEQRIDKIKKYLLEHRSADYKTLCEAVPASLSTVRRDVDKLAKEGFLEKKRGGIDVYKRQEDSLQDARLAFLEGIQAFDTAAGTGFAAFIKPYVYQKGQNRRRKCLRRLARDVPADAKAGNEDGETFISLLEDPGADIELSLIHI